MTIDTHVHLIRGFDNRGARQIYSRNPASPDDYLAVMDSAGIDRAFFISWSPEDIPSDLTGKKIAASAVAETMNPAFAREVMARHPERFYWFPCHLGPTVPNHMALAREHLALGATGLKLVLSFWGELPDDPRPRALCALAREYRAQVIVDTSFWYLGKDRPQDPESLPEGHREVAKRVKDHPDYLAHLEALIASFADVNFSLAHAGAREFTPEHARETGLFVRRFPNVFADLGALDTGSPALESLVEAAGADRVMFGTDWPHFAQGAAMAEAIARVRRPGRFAAGVSERILGENALAFVKGRPPGLRPGKA